MDRIILRGDRLKKCTQKSGLNQEIHWICEKKMNQKKRTKLELMEGNLKKYVEK